jgi:hypothetical protein
VRDIDATDDGDPEVPRKLLERAAQAKVEADILIGIY